MKAGVLAIPLVALAALPARAQGSAEEPPRPEIIIGGAPPAADTRGDDRRQGDTGGRRAARLQQCVDVVIGSERSFGCLNEKLRHQVERVNPAVNAPPLDAGSPDVKTGVVNIPAVKEQYGQNFGVSAVPFRPPPPVFAVPTGRR